MSASKMLAALYGSVLMAVVVLAGTSALAGGVSAPGSPDYPNGGLIRLDTQVLTLPEYALGSAVIDADNGYAYFGTRNTPASVIKVALGATGDPPVRVAALPLSSENRNLTSAVIDTSNGYAYFGTQTHRARVVKVALGDGDDAPQFVGDVELGFLEADLRAAVIDPENGYAYFVADRFGTFPPSVVMINLGEGDEPPVRVGALELEGDDGSIRTAIVDTANGYLYLGTRSRPSRIIKIALSSEGDLPRRVATTELLASDSFVEAGDIDAGAGYGYFISGQSETRVVKVALGSGDAPPVRIGSIQIGASAQGSAVHIDSANGLGYFFIQETSGTGAHILQVALGSGESLPAIIHGFALETEVRHFTRVSTFDPDTGLAYFGVRTLGVSPARVLKMDFGDGTSPLAHIGHETLDTGDYSLYSSHFDSNTGDIYFTGAHDDPIGYNPPGKLIRLSAARDRSPLRHLGFGPTERGERRIHTSVADFGNGYAYLGVDGIGTRGRVVKMALHRDDGFPVRVSAVDLDVGNRLRSSVIDTANGYAYFGVDTSPGHIVKVALQDGDTSPTIVGSLVFDQGEEAPVAAIIDTANGYAYFGTNAVPAQVVKVALGSGDNPPSRIGSITLEAGEHSIRAAAIDPYNGFGHFATHTSPARIVKVALGEGGSLPERLAALTLDSPEDYIGSGFIDVESGLGFFGTTVFPQRIVKVALGSGDGPPHRVGSLGLLADGGILRSAMMDPLYGYGYFGASVASEQTFSNAARVIQIGLGQKGFLKGTRFTMSEARVVNDVRLYSHAAAGNVRLAIYRDGEPKRRLWQSPPIANTVEEGEIVVPVSSGSPAFLALDEGTYWAAWQVDTLIDVPSYTEGSEGDGFHLPMAFGTPPARLHNDDLTPTNEVWTMYITHSDMPDGRLEGFVLQGIGSED